MASSPNVVGCSSQNGAGESRQLSGGGSATPFSGSFFSPYPLLNHRKAEAAAESRPSRSPLFLTWEDLWVLASGQKGEPVRVLSGLTGLAQPGEVLAIMGPSGCGKSTLLDSLAGRLAPNLRQKGDILINGRKRVLAFGTSAYVTQDDVLMTSLTVREAVQYATELQLPSSLSREAKIERAEETIREMGLASVADVRIGGRYTKGISGGQQRRVSICMEILKRPKLLFLDEPTSGLDSAAAFHVISRIAKMATSGDQMTVVAAMHQPGPEVFELFKVVSVLAYGRAVFFGPPDAASQFFASNGFPVPSLTNPSDHYLKTINKDFDGDIEEGTEAEPTSTEKAIEILVQSYTSSVISKEAVLHISKIREMEGEAVKEKKRITGFLLQCFVLTRRSFVNMYRDLGYYWLRFAIYVALCLCVGTIYHNVGYSFGSIQARVSMLLFIVAFLTFMAIGGFPSFVEDMKIFERERWNGHYGVTSFAIANTLSSTPYLALISIIPGAIAYYFVGFQSSIYHFIYFALVLFSCMMLVEGLMMIVASLVPDFLMGIITGAGIQGVMLLNSGFFRLPNDLPKPFSRYPMYYIAFHKYANQGLYKNEFIGLTFPNNQAGGPPTNTGEEILKEIWQVEMGYSKWVDLGILLGMVLLYRFIFLVIVKLKEKASTMLKELRARISKESTSKDGTFFYLTYKLNL